MKQLDIKNCPWNKIKVGDNVWFFNLDDYTIISHKVLQKPNVTSCSKSYRIEFLEIGPKEHTDDGYCCAHYDFSGYVYPNKKCACYYNEPNIFKEDGKEEHFLIFANKEDCIEYALKHIDSKINELSSAKEQLINRFK